MTKKSKRKTVAKKPHKKTKTIKNKKPTNKKHNNKRASKSYLFPVIGGLVAISIIVAGGWFLRSSASSRPYYIGMDKCIACHQKEYKKMQASPSMQKMMNAINLLQEAEKNSGQCLSCHTTGYGKKWDKSVPFDKRASVQCEACHGPGSEYIKIMEQGYDKNNQGLRDEVVKAGLIIAPKKDTCFQCHHDGDIGPDGQPIIWDFEKHRSLILH